MFLVERYQNGQTDHFGPFPTRARAIAYTESFDKDARFEVKPLIVPNCVQVNLKY